MRYIFQQNSSKNFLNVWWSYSRSLSPHSAANHFIRWTAHIFFAATPAKNGDWCFLFLLAGGVGGGRLLLFPSAESSAKFPGPRLWEEIPFPSMVRKYPCSARNTFPGLIKKKSFLGNAQNFPLPAIVFFQDQTGKIPRKSWKPVSIFYSVNIFIYTVYLPVFQNICFAFLAGRLLMRTYLPV